MHTHLMSMYKKITAVIVLILFSFILLAPTADALSYDPKKRRSIISPDEGDTDPWNELEVYDPPPPPDDEKDDITFELFIFSGKFYLYNLFRIPLKSLIEEDDNNFYLEKDRSR